MKVRALVVSLVVLVCASAGAQKQKQTADPAIHAVETGLLPPTVLKDGATHAYTINERMKKYDVPGVSVAVVHDGRIVWAKGYGVAKLGGRPITPETLFQAGSISKPVASVAALRMVEDGKLNLDENVNSKLKTWKIPDNEFTKQRDVTLREIMTHTAGITVHGFPGYATTDKVPTIVKVLNGEKPANTKPVRVDMVPGTKWRYSGGGFTVMQLLMTDVSGQDFPTLTRELVLKPFGMTSSTYQNPLPVAWRSRAATPYAEKLKPIRGGAHTYPEMAAAGLWTTPSDLARFIIALQRALAGTDNRVLTQRMAWAMLHHQYDDSRAPGFMRITRSSGDWGLGIAVFGQGKNAGFEHGGVDEGFEAALAGFDAIGDGAVVMTNAAGGIALAQEVLASIARAYHWPGNHFSSRVVNPVKLSPEQLSDYLGNYEFADGGKPIITARGGKLFISSATNPPEELYCTGGDKFVVLSSTNDFVFGRSAGQVKSLSVYRGSTNLGTANRISTK